MTTPKQDRAKSICLLGVATEDGNNGTRALCAGAIACILKEFPDAQISIFDYAREGRTIPFTYKQKTIQVRLVNARFSKNLFQRNHIARMIAEASISRLILSKTLRRAFIGRNPWLEHLQQADLAAAISGGDSFSDIYGIQRLLYVSLPQILVLLLGKPLVLLPQTLGPFKGTLARFTAGWILKRATRIYSRDSAGLRKAAGWIGSRLDSAKLRFCYDVAFALEATPPAVLDVVGFEGNSQELRVDYSRESALVGLNVSGLLSLGGYSRNNMFGLILDYNELINDLINFLIEQKSAKVLLIPHVIGEGPECDSPACARIYERLKSRYKGNLGFVRSTYNQSEIKYIIGRCSLFIGSRMHACIAAASQNVPVVPMAYSDKFVGVMQTVGIEANVVDLRRMNKEESFEIIDRALDNGVQIRQHLARTMPHVIESVLSVFEGIDSGVLGVTDASAVGEIPATV
ncbi:MAG TPA: polysaccharide pyruvyl transferase family protein [Candidatus Sulfotelmatobacter sp.]|nr:polysaccharide pyruvyl transferase family protein [Candidatus Sulfotelmatobacter sp.]